MKILGIETSCDETGLAALNLPDSSDPLEEAEILSNLVASQTSIHRPWGGVVPNLARREHQKNLIPLLEQSLRASGVLTARRRWRLSQKEKTILNQNLTREKQLSRKLKRFLRRWSRPEIDLIAVTVGPGLEPALWTGANLALALSQIWQIPLVPVDHVEAHIFANWLTEKKPPQKWPMIALVVSGGHTELVLMEQKRSYRIIGQTRDDAAGECFDKTARVLGLGYPGGPAISEWAEKWRRADQSKAPRSIREITFPRPMIQSPDHDFSFSGLKTAVLYRHRELPPAVKDHPLYRAKASTEIEDAINDVLIAKTIKAAKAMRAETILVGGGVAANRSLRRRLTAEAKKNSLTVFIPPVHFCTDNAAIIALTGLVHSKKAALSDTIKVKANLNLDNG